MDELFGLKFGRLPYRTLDFQFETWEQEYFQPCATVNYTVSEDYTRITEFKYFLGQKLPRTTTVKEYSRAYTGAAGEIPYYAIINPENNALYEKYRALAGTVSRGCTCWGGSRSISITIWTRLRSGRWNWRTG